MSYTPPAGNAIAFVATGASYTPPSGGAVDFSFVEGAPELTLSGSITLGGAAQVVVGSPLVLSVEGGVMLGGGAQLVTYEPRPLAIAGAIVLGGGAQLQFFPRWSGAIRLSGKAVLNSGRALSAAGAIRLSGKVALNVGRVFSAHGGLKLCGVAAFRRGVSLRADGAIILGGAAAFSALSATSLVASGEIKLGGRFVATAPRKGWPASMAVLTRPAEVLHVVG